MPHLYMVVSRSFSCSNSWILVLGNTIRARHFHWLCLVLSTLEFHTASGYQQPTKQPPQTSSHPMSYSTTTLQAIVSHSQVLAAWHAKANHIYLYIFISTQSPYQPHSQSQWIATFIEYLLYPTLNSSSWKPDATYLDKDCHVWWLQFSDGDFYSMCHWYFADLWFLTSGAVILFSSGNSPAMIKLIRYVYGDNFWSQLCTILLTFYLCYAQKCMQYNALRLDMAHPTWVSHARQTYHSTYIIWNLIGPVNVQFWNGILLHISITHGNWKEVASGCTTHRGRSLQFQAPALPLWDDLQPGLSLRCRIGHHLRSQIAISLGMNSRHDLFPTIHPFTERRTRCSYITAQLPSRIVYDGI